MRLFLMLLFCVATVGCGPGRQSLPVAPVHAPVPADQARVVIGRKANVLQGQGIKMKVVRDGVEIGALAPNGYLAWEQPPGKTTLNIEGVPLPLTLPAGRPTCIEAHFAPDGSGAQVTVVDPGNYDRLIAYEPPENKP